MTRNRNSKHEEKVNIYNNDHVGEVKTDWPTIPSIAGQDKQKQLPKRFASSEANRWRQQMATRNLLKQQARTQQRHANAEAAQLQFAEMRPKPSAKQPPNAYLGRAGQVSLGD